MKHLLLIPLLAILLVSCTQYRYEVQYEKCNWQTWSLTYTWINVPLIRNTHSSINQLLYNWDEKNPPIVNVCGMTYIETELTNK